MKNIFFLSENTHESARALVDMNRRIAPYQTRRIAEIVRYCIRGNNNLFHRYSRDLFDFFQVKQIPPEDFEEDHIYNYWIQSELRILTLCDYAMCIHEALRHHSRVHARRDYRNDLHLQFYRISRLIDVPQFIGRDQRSSYHTIIENCKFHNPPYFGPLKIFEESNGNVYDAYRRLLRMETERKEGAPS